MAGPAMGAVSAVEGILSLAEPLALSTNYAMCSKFPVRQLDIQSLVSAYIQGTITKQFFTERGSWLGYTADRLENFVQIMQGRPSMPDLVTLYRRGAIPAYQFYDLARKNGYPSDMTKLFLTAFEYFPPPPDLIRMAVREVYSPAIRQKFGMDQDLPKIYLQEAYKAGLPADQAKNYWAAHWELPSAGQLFEMFQRDILTRDELNMGLKAIDIMPFWREKLTGLAYNVVTRVDARRMYGLGVYDDKKLKDTYRHMGYSNQDADDLVLFTKRYEHLDADGLTKDAITNAFKKDLLTMEEFRQKLVEMNYTDEVVDFWVSLAVYDKMAANLDNAVTDLQDQFYMGIITIDEMRQALTAADVPTNLIESVITKTLAAKSKSKKVPTKADLDEWLHLDIISEEYFVTRLKLLGYGEEDALNYLTAHNMTIEHKKRKFLDVKTYQRWLKNNIMDETRFIQTLTAMGLSDEDITAALTEAPNVK
jgi:hypothetical protein